MRESAWRLRFLSLIPAVALSLASPTSFAQKAVGLSPAGERILAAKYAEYPQFDEEKARREAAELHPVVPIGEPVTILVRGREVKGAFRGMDAKYLKIGDRNVALIDLAPEVIARFSEEENRKLQERHVARELAAYELARDDALADVRNEITLAYPPVPEQVLKVLFEKIPADRRAADVEAFKALYDARLPLVGNDRDFLRETAEAFVAAHPELIRAGNNFWLKDELAAMEKRRDEIAAARAIRRRTRILQPTTATPTITPDGGEYQSWIEVVLASSTPGAIIHYSLDGEEPNEDSPRYTKPFKLSTMATIKAVAFHPEFNDSEVITAAPWEGGLYASYFPRMTFKGETLTRIDRVIDFNWTSNPPVPEIPADLISMIWTGQLKPKVSGEYTFYLTGDDGFRLWLNDRVVVDGWKEQSATEYEGKVMLEAGRNYDIKITLAEVMGVVSLKWEWEGPETPRQVVPQECLTPGGRHTKVLQRWNHREPGKTAYAYRDKMTNPGAWRGNYRLPVRGGESRWQQLSIGD